MDLQTKRGQENLYKYYTTTFSLQMSFIGQALKIKLKDFIDWIIYEKEYSQEDSGGGQINKKVDLFDIYTIISQRIGANEEKDMNDSHEEIVQYSYGNIIKNNGIKCYKIEREGKLTVYMRLNALDIKKQMNCDSNLQLNKVKEMSEIEKLTERSEIDKKIYKKIFLKKIESLEKQNKRLGQELKKVEQKMAQKQKNNEQLIQSMKQEIKKINMELTSTNQELEIDRQRFKVKDIEYQTKISRLQHNLFNPYFMSKFTVTIGSQNPKVTRLSYIGEENWTNFFFNQIINYNQLFYFYIHLIKIKSGKLMIGIADYSKQKQKRSSYNSNNAIAYYYDGRKWPGQQAQGSGFKQGQILKISVSLSNKTVKWSVDGQQRASLTHQMLADKSRFFVPYIEIYNTNDMIGFSKQSGV